MGEPRVAAVVVNWNRRDLLALTLASLYADGYSGLSVIVVDNGSGDGSVEMVRSDFPQAKIIANRRNLGFARGNNQGILEALETGADYVFFLNNDATVARDCLNQLVGLLESHSPAGAAGPFVVYADQPELIWYGGGEVSLWTGLVRHLHIRQRFDRPRFKAAATGYITGCAMLVRSRLLQELGGFDVAFALYSEDVDLCLRLRKVGWELWATPEAVVRHQVSASTGGGISPLKGYHRARSTALLLRRWAPKRAWPVLLVLGPVGAAAASLKLLASGEVKATFALWRGAVGGILGRSVPARYRLADE